MKRFFSCILVAIALLYGAITTIMSEKEFDFSKGSQIEHKHTEPNTNNSSFSKTDFFLSGNESELITFSYSFYQTPIRIISKSDSQRIKKFKQVVRQQYVAGENSFLLESAFKQLDGYYLYHLRKILI